MSRQNSLIALILIAIVGVLAACGGGEPDPNAPLTSADFNRVCQGEGVARGAAYDPAGAAPHTVIIMDDSTIGAQYDEYLTRFMSNLPEEWFAQIVDGTFDYSTVELVTCIHRTGVEPNEACEFEDGYVLNAHNATYDMTLRSTQTAEVISQESVTVNGECPMLHMFDEGETEEDYFPVVAETQIEGFIAPYVAP